MGHALFTVEDIIVRYHRMRGKPTLWLPGSDHAGIETQYVFEKVLAKENKSRFDFDRETLFRTIWDFVEKNREINILQMKKLGFSLDWSRYHYSLEPEIIEKVLVTFKKMYADGLVYRGHRIVNYCVRCGTAFSDLEVDYKERKDYLYFLDYGMITVATTRPETIFADVAVAVNPKDKRYKNLVGKTATIPLKNISIPIITDSGIDIKFGTGALKVTPAYDPVDFEIGQKNDLELIRVIDQQGRMMESPRVPKELVRLTVGQAREKSVALLEAAGKLSKKEPLVHSVGTCYRCGTVIEPMVIPQWFVKTKPLAEPAIKAVREGRTKIVPKKRFEKMYFDWMENIKDWNISRQIVWGVRIPAWKCPDCSTNDREEWTVTAGETPAACQKCGGANLSQDTDTFDTWFLSGQWPINTLKSRPGDFEYFYPTSVLDTLWDILFFWVGRMMMFGLYLTGDVPFKTVHLHARVVDAKGQKMSKSKGNVVNPIDMVDKYGADALRMALVISVAPASDIAISDDKVRAQRNFANKLWNIGRFLLSDQTKKDLPKQSQEDIALKALINETVGKTTKHLEGFQFGQASETLYEVAWHQLADVYIENYKKGSVSYSVLRDSYLTLLKLLHPFIPFATEEIWGLFENPGGFPLIISPWPTTE